MFYASGSGAYVHAIFMDKSSDMPATERAFRLPSAVAGSTAGAAYLVGMAEVRHCSSLFLVTDDAIWVGTRRQQQQQQQQRQQQQPPQLHQQPQPQPPPPAEFELVANLTASSANSLGWGRLSAAAALSAAALDDGTTLLLVADGRRVFRAVLACGAGSGEKAEAEAAACVEAQHSWCDVSVAGTDAVDGGDTIIDVAWVAPWRRLVALTSECVSSCSVFRKQSLLPVCSRCL